VAASPWNSGSGLWLQQPSKCVGRARLIAMVGHQGRAPVPRVSQAHIHFLKVRCSTYAKTTSKNSRRICSSNSGLRIACGRG